VNVIPKPKNLSWKKLPLTAGNRDGLAHGDARGSPAGRRCLIHAAGVALVNRFRWRNFAERG
jgi:hypothetical protein